MKDEGYFHLILSVLLILVLLLVAAAIEWQLEHPEAMSQASSGRASWSLNRSGCWPA